MKWFPGIDMAKDPNAVLDYKMDFSDWLENGDTINSYLVDPGGQTRIRGKALLPQFFRGPTTRQGREKV